MRTSQPKIEINRLTFIIQFPLHSDVETETRPQRPTSKRLNPGGRLWSHRRDRWRGGRYYDDKKTGRG